MQAMAENIQKMRAEKPCRMQSSEFQTEPYSASYELWGAIGGSWELPGAQDDKKEAPCHFCATSGPLFGPPNGTPNFKKTFPEASKNTFRKSSRKPIPKG